MSAVAGLFRWASARLRELSGTAVSGPWESLDDGDRLVAWRGLPDCEFIHVVEEPISAGTSRYLAMMHPPVAEAMARVFDVHAARIEAGSGGSYTEMFGAVELIELAMAVVREEEHSGARYALDVTYNSERPDGWPAGERIELPRSVDADGAARRAAELLVLEHIDRVDVVAPRGA